jgi:hypothetical protein
MGQTVAMCDDGIKAPTRRGHIAAPLDPWMDTLWASLQALQTVLEGSNQWQTLHIEEHWRTDLGIGNALTIKVVEKWGST